MISATLDLSKFNLDKKLRSVAQAAEMQTNKVADLGKQQAKHLAPRQTGALIQAITSENKKGWSVIKSTQPNRFNWRGQKFPYHIWMHLNNGRMGAGRFIRSGSPTYMYDVYNWLTKYFPEQVRIEVVTELKKN